MKLTKRMFVDLAIYMIGFGITVGIIFPIFTRLIGIPAEHIDVIFVLACILAGLIVGTVNILITRGVVGSRLEVLSNRMKHSSKSMQDKDNLNLEECLDHCVLPVESDDVIGQTSEAYNTLMKSFLQSMLNERSIRTFTELFTNELDINHLSEKALSYLIEYTNSTAGVLLLDKGGEIEVSSSYLIEQPESLVTQQIVRQTFDSNKRLLLDLSDVVTVQTGLLNFQPKGLLVEPIAYKNQVLGVIVLASLKQYEESDLTELDIYTHGLSLGIHNAIIHDRLEQLSVLDPLTKTYNRRFGMSRLEEEFKRSIRTGKPFGVLMLDIDHFKNVNDTYGHIAGDHVLRTIADHIRNVVRTEDTLVRYGGEEFLLICPGATKQSLKIVGEKIRRIIEETNISYQRQDIKVTISLGGASSPELQVEEPSQIIQFADEKLYEAKETGRNKVVL